MGFEMTLLRMLAFRPDTALRSRAARGGAPASRWRRRRSDSRDAARAPRAQLALPPLRAGRAPSIVRLTGIDADNWPAVVEAASLSGMVRQFALNCVPAKFEHDVLTLQDRSGDRGPAHAADRGEAGAGLVEVSRPGHSRHLRNGASGRLQRRRGSARSTEQDKVDARRRGVRGGSRGQGIARALRRRCGCRIGETRELVTRRSA